MVDAILYDDPQILWQLVPELPEAFSVAGGHCLRQRVDAMPVAAVCVPWEFPDASRGDLEPSTARPVKRKVFGDPEEPWAQHSILEALRGACQEFQEGLLDGVMRKVFRCEEARRMGGQACLVAQEKRLHGILVAGAQPPEERLVGGFPGGIGFGGIVGQFYSMTLSQPWTSGYLPHWMSVYLS